MSRSRKRTPIVQGGTSKSRSIWKQEGHSVCRATVRKKLSCYDPDESVLPEKRYEYSDYWSGPDYKFQFDPTKDPKYMRK